MQEQESIMIVRCELRIPSLGITVRHHSASLVMPSSYPRDRIYNLHLTTIKDSYKSFLLPGVIDMALMAKTDVGMSKDFQLTSKLLDMCK